MIISHPNGVGDSCQDRRAEDDRISINDKNNIIRVLMTTEVLVTRRGQTTIPVEIRKKLRIKEGTRLSVESVGDKIIFRKAPSLEDLDGSSKLSPSAAIRLLDKMREAE